MATSTGANTITINGKLYTKQFNVKTGKFDYIPYTTQPATAIPYGRPNANKPIAETPLPKGWMEPIPLTGRPVASANGAAGGITKFQDIKPTTQTVTTPTGTTGKPTVQTPDEQKNQTQNTTDPVKEKIGQLLGQYGMSNIDYDALEKQAIEQMTPYYQQLLDEANGDVELAKKRLEEDYVTGKRKVTQRTDDDMRALATGQKSELISALGTLNKQGLLSTILPAKPPSNEMTLTSGEKVGTELPYATEYGGLGGKRLKEIRDAQKARQEALTKAKDEDLSGLLTSKERDLEDLQRKAQKYPSELANRKGIETRELADYMYQRAQRQQEQKQREISSPYMGSSG